MQIRKGYLTGVTAQMELSMLEEVFHHWTSSKTFSQPVTVGFKGKGKAWWTIDFRWQRTTLNSASQRKWGGQQARIVSPRHACSTLQAQLSFEQRTEWNSKDSKWYECMCLWRITEMSLFVFCSSSLGLVSLMKVLPPWRQLPMGVFSCSPILIHLTVHSIMNSSEGSPHQERQVWFAFVPRS